jgi:hypothetical protein
VINSFVLSGEIKHAYERALKRWAMELSLRTMRLFHVDDGDDDVELRENVGDEDDGSKTDSSSSMQLHDEVVMEDK